MTPAAARAPLVELFRSIQGEGRHVGRPMRFVRTATCPLRCTYCDTPHSYVAPPAFPVYGPRGVVREPNPASAGRVADLVASLQPQAGAADEPVSVTGGEPLVHAAFVRELAELLADAPTHLETAAMHPEGMRRVLPAIRHLSADYKLPVTLGGEAPRDVRSEHLACLEAACAVDPGQLTIDVKVVLTGLVDDDAVAAMLADLAPFRGRIAVILQPVTPFGAEAGRPPPPAPRLAAWLDRALAAGFDARVLPQVHRQLGVP